ncbi:4-hydroxy-tetrahydrodipicolinate synthase [Ruminococcaceae bacterium AM07-15]|nr:4-hydroxy-tetrahydrodipicolinate synthase [Ruminococcaceae bacterium AM07-15]
MSQTLRTFSGSLVALATPFGPDGQVDYKQLEALVEFQLSHHTDGIVALGTTAETPTLSQEEKDKIAQTVIGKVAGRIPVIVGAGSNDTLHAAALARRYEAMGADGLLVVTPYYNKANKSGMLAHFRTIADGVNIPILLYNVPSRTGCSIPLDVLEELSHHKNIVGIKEASGDIAYVTAAARLLNQDFCMLSGNDDEVLPLLALGGSGVISVLANIAPDQTHELVSSYQSGDIAHARDVQLKYLELIHALFAETSPAPLKEAMNLLGMKVGSCRLPLGPVSESTRQRLEKALTILK